MRALFAVLALLLLAATASARPLPGLPVQVTVGTTLPSDGCADCVGASASAGTSVPDCYDCGGVGVGAGVAHDGDGTTVWAKACKGGFVYVCPVDESLTV